MIKDPESGHLGSVDFNSVYEHIPELKDFKLKSQQKVLITPLIPLKWNQRIGLKSQE